VEADDYGEDRRAALGIMLYVYWHGLPFRVFYVLNDPATGAAMYGHSAEHATESPHP
jgi:hypothetical protein